MTLSKTANALDQEFGEDRIVDAVRKNWAGSPTEICDAVLAGVRQFLGKMLPHDDQTLMVVRLQKCRPRPVIAMESRPAKF